MFQKRDHRVEIRKKLGVFYRPPSGHSKRKGRQCFSFGGRKCGLSREVLEGFGRMVLKKLDAGVSEGDAATWVKDAVKRYGD